MSALFDDGGRPAEVGRSIGRWLDESDFIFGGEDHQHDRPSTIGPHSFPRDWPDVYEESVALRSMLRKTGPCAAKRVSVVPNITKHQIAETAHLGLRPLHSLNNAEAVKKHLGLAVVEGWAMHDLLDDVTGAAFVAERYWWNCTADGAWVDYSPRAENVGQLLLVEPLVLPSPKKPCILTARQHQLGLHLLEMRFPKTRAIKTLSWSSQTVLNSEGMGGIVKRVRLGCAQTMHELSSRVQEDAALCEALVHNGACGVAATHLRSRRLAAPAVRFLAAISTAALKTELHRQVVTSFMAADGIGSLLGVLAAADAVAATDAAAALSNFCFQASEVQECAAGSGAILLLITQLKERQPCGVAEACLALWHLQVSCPSNITAAALEGAGEALLAVLSDKDAGPSARINAAGALMMLVAAPGMQDELAALGAVAACSEIISDPTHPAHFRGQTAGALMNLLSGHHENCCSAAGGGGHEIVGALLDLARSSSTPSGLEAYAAGALANMVACGGKDVAKAAANLGAWEVFVGLMSKPQSLMEVFAGLANLVQHVALPGVEVGQNIIELAIASIAEESDPVCIQALTLCMNLAPVVSLKARLLKAGVVEPVLDLLKSDDEALRERASGTLANLLNGHAETVATVYMQTPNIAKRTVQALESEYLGTVQRELARTLAALASRRSEPLRRAGAIEMLACLLQDSGSEAAGEAALLLMNFVLREREREKLLERGVVETLVRLLGDERVDGHAAGALANLVAGSKKVAFAALSAGAAPALAKIIGGCKVKAVPGSESVMEWAVGALSGLAQYDGGGMVLAAVLNEGVLESIMQMLLHDRGMGQELALFLLWSLRGLEEKELRSGLPGGSEQLCRLCSRLSAGPLRDFALRLAKLC